MNADHKPKKPILPSGSSKSSRIFIVVGGGILLLVILMIVMSLFSSAKNAGREKFVKAAQQQTEIARISKIGSDRAKGSTAKNLALTTSYSMQSDQSNLLSALKLQGIKVSSKELALSKNQKTDKLLTEAEQANRFDEVFVETLQSEIAEYQKTLKSAFDDAESKQLQQTLSDQYDHATLLVSAKQ